MYSLLSAMLAIGVVGCRDNQTITPPTEELSPEAQARKSAENLDRFKEGIEDKTIANDYEVRNGVVHVKNPAVLRKALENLDSFTSSFKQREPGFVSFQNKIDEALEKSQSVSSKAEADVFLKQWGVYVREENEMLFPQLYVRFNHLLSEDGALFVGKRIYLFTNGADYIILDGDKSKIKQIKAGKVDPETVLRIDTKSAVVSTPSGGRMAAVGCASLSGFRERDNRRGTVNVNGVLSRFDLGFNPATGINETFADASVVINGYSRKKVGWWWDRYNTVHSLRINYLARFVVQGTERQSIEPDDFTTTDPHERDGIDDRRSIGSNTVPTSIVNTTQVRIFLDVRRGFYTSRGLNNEPVFYNQCNP